MKKKDCVRMCKICRKYPCDCRCPNYKEPKSIHYCSVCEEGIQNGEEYIENYQGEYIHFECIQGIRWLLKWLDCEIKEDYKYDY